MTEHMIGTMGETLSTRAHNYRVRLLTESVRFGDAVRMTGFTSKALAPLAAAVQAEGDLLNRSLQRAGDRRTVKPSLVKAHFNRLASRLNRCGDTMDVAYRRLDSAVASVREGDRDAFPTMPNGPMWFGVIAVQEASEKLTDALSVTQHMNLSGHRNLLAHLAVAAEEMRGVPGALNKTLTRHGPGARDKVAVAVLRARPNMIAATAVLLGVGRQLARVAADLEQ